MVAVPLRGRFAGHKLLFSRLDFCFRLLPVVQIRSVLSASL
jgi:hypothetical protein